MSKRALKRQLREGAFDAGQFEGDDKVRRLPLDRGWSPLAHSNHNHAPGEDRDQGYLKTIKAKSPGQEALIKAIDQKNLVMALGPAGTGKTYLAIAKAVGLRLDGLQISLLTVVVAVMTAVRERRPAPIDRQPADLIVPLELSRVERAFAQLSLQGSLAHSRPPNGA